MESEPIKVSRSLFYQLKPFWIVEKKESQRDTCLCKIHANFGLLTKKLFSLKLIKTSNIKDFVESLVCKSSQEKCMYRTCEKCKNNIVRIDHNPELISYDQWVVEEIDRKGAKGLMYHVKVTTKKKYTCSVNDFVKILNASIPKYLQHVYDTKHQQEKLRDLRKNFKIGEVMILMDFSENYQCKFASEIQSVHFGASKTQLSLHCGAFFYRDIKDEIQCVSFIVLFLIVCDMTHRQYGVICATYF